MSEVYNFSTYSEEERGLIKEIETLRKKVDYLTGLHNIGKIHIQALLDIINSDEVTRIAQFASLHGMGFDKDESEKNQKTCEAAEAFMEMLVK